MTCTCSCIRSRSAAASGCSPKAPGQPISPWPARWPMTTGSSTSPIPAPSQRRPRDGIDRGEGSITVRTALDGDRVGGAGSYVRVNGLDVYCEIHGSGFPLVLLHGAMGTIDSCFAGLLPALAAARQVIAVELQGHGHTADLDRPLSYQQMADDTAALLRALGI